MRGRGGEVGMRRGREEERRRGEEGERRRVQVTGGVEKRRMPGRS